MILRHIVVSPIEPAQMSLRHPLGVDLDLRVMLHKNHDETLDPSPLYPQLALLPRSRGGTYAYDMTVYDAGNGIVQLLLPGAALTDVAGYGVELYLRKKTTPDEVPVPTQLAATGVLRLQGSAYASYGPLGMINVPKVVGPPGPAGPPGEQGLQGLPGPTGQRGSIWLTGTGAPTVTEGVLAGDMYLDEATGNVWRFDGAVWLHQ